MHSPGTTIAGLVAACARHLTLAGLAAGLSLLSAGVVEAAPAWPPVGPEPATVGAPAPGVSSITCMPRPRVIVSSQPALLLDTIGLPGQDALDVTITATGAGNSLHVVRFAATTNALVSVLDAQAHGAPFEMTFAAGAEPTSLSFVLWRPNASQGSIARLVIVDACGEWTTFVGRGSRVQQVR